MAIVKPEMVSSANGKRIQKSSGSFLCFGIVESSELNELHWATIRQAGNINTASSYVYIASRF